MGMFDYVRIIGHNVLPKVTTERDRVSLRLAKGKMFQSKSMECGLRVYVVQNKQLFTEDHETKTLAPCDYTGDMEVHYPRFFLRFVEGRLTGDVAYEPREE